MYRKLIQKKALSFHEYGETWPVDHSGYFVLATARGCVSWEDQIGENNPKLAQKMEWQHPEVKLSH